MAAPTLKLTAKVDDHELRNLIVRLARAWGVSIKETSRRTLGGMIRDALALTPPASARRQGKDAQRQGELAILRDLNRMGFEPVVLKGERKITTVFGQLLKTPIMVKTKENPKFADPVAFHARRLRRKHGGQVTRGGKQAFYVDVSKFKALLSKLFKEVGRLASGWVQAAAELNITAAAWIKRHGGARGTSVQVIESDTRYGLRVVNHFPDSAGNEAAEMERRIEIFKQRARNDLIKQLKYKLKR
jgi:hypothetical protein